MQLEKPNKKDSEGMK